jgi:cytochrome P450
VPEHLVRPFPFVYGTDTDRDPFAMTKEIHEGPDVFYAHHAYTGGRPAWVVRRASDLREIYLDTEHFENAGLSVFSKLIGDTWTNLPFEIDPPRHKVYRSVLNHWFTPKAMSEMEAQIRERAVEFIEAFRARGECEFVAEFAFGFPIKVFLELVNLPLELTPQFLRWEKGLLHSPDLQEIASATRSVVAYLREQIELRKAKPGKDLLSRAIVGEIEGRKWNDDELVGFAFNLFIGGLDTVSNNIALQFCHLARHPEHQRILRENPDRIPDAVEEMMRAYAPVTTWRTCKSPIKFKGVQMMPGDKVAMCTTLAARDPGEYDQPQEVRLDRRPKHVSFGHGIHLCLGIHLARREMRIAIDEFLRRIPQFELKPGHVMRYRLGMIQPMSLPLQWAA